MAEKYQPTKEETNRAEEQMSGEQKEFTERREKLHTDKTERKYFEDFIRRVIKGERVPANFSMGPTCSYGDRLDDPFDGYDWETRPSDEQLKKWKTVLSPGAYAVLEKNLNMEGGAQVFYHGKTFQAPTTSSGKGSYYYWKHYPGCWMDVTEHEESFVDEGSDESIVISEGWVNIALEMTEEERKKWAMDLANQYSIKIDG